MNPFIDVDHAAGCATDSSLASRWTSALLDRGLPRPGALIWAPSRSVTVKHVAGALAEVRHGGGDVEVELRNRRVS